MSFWGELKRRNVYKVGVAYAIVAWLLIQFAGIAFPHLGFPSWAVPFVIIILIIGFPIALLLAWAYEVTPEGIKRTKEVPLAESITHITGQKLNYIVTGLLVVAVAVLVVDNYLLDKDAVEPEVVSTETEQAPIISDVEEGPKSIAVLPFVDISPDKDQEYFVDGLSEELINCLTQIPNLGVTGRTSSFTFKGSNKKTQEIASELGVENILEGSVRKAGNSLRITAQLVRAADDLQLWSRTYDRELKDIFEVQEDIATAVADELKVTLGIGQSFKQLGGTENLEAYELYLAAVGQMNNWGMESQALASIDEALALDPEFALAWATKAYIHQNIIPGVPANRIASELESGLNAALKAIELEPNLASGYFSLGGSKFLSGDFIGAELAYRKGMELTTETFAQLVGNFSVFYGSVGYFKRAHHFLDAVRRYDPLNQPNRSFYFLSFVYLGDTQRAIEEHELGRSLFGDQWIWGNLFMTIIRVGIADPISRDEIPEIPAFDPIWSIARDHLESPKEGLVELRRLYSDDDNLSNINLLTISIWAAYFGDLELALEAMEKMVRMSAGMTQYLWLPLYQEVRQMPRFKEYVKEIGLVDYWNKFGWPDICHKLDNGDFECD